MNSLTTKKNNFLIGALMLSIGGFIAKLLGAVYRIPLTNLIGSYGIGVYQLVFPLYALLITISSAGIPNAISKLISEKLAVGDERQATAVFRHSLLLLAVLGALGSVALFFLAGTISRIQGNMDTEIAYKIISPSVFLVCVMSAYRGYFQGRMNMSPTALSQVVEQLVKLIFALGLIIILKASVLTGVYIAVTAVTVSEVIALVILYFQYRASRPESIKGIGNDIPFWRTAKTIFALSIPITLSNAVLPLTQLIDSVLVVNLIKENATLLYGLYGGPVHSLISLPVVLSLGVAIAVIPSVSKSLAKGDASGVNEKVNSSMKLTMLLALPSMMGLILLSMPVVRLLYSSLPKNELEICSRLLQISGVGVLFLSVLQTATAILQASGKVYVPLVAIGVGTLFKIVLNIVLLPIQDVNIYGCAMATVVCYLVAVLVNLVYIIGKQKIAIRVDEVLIKPLCATAIMSLFITLINYFFASFTSNWLGTLVVVGVSAGIYFVSLILFKVLSCDEIQMIKRMFKIK